MNKINIGTIGHHDNGKVTLSDAITKILSFNNCTLIDNYSIDEEDSVKKVTINSKNFFYQLQEQKRTINDEEFDASIILVSPDSMVKAREDILLSRQKEIPRLALLVDSSFEIEDKDLLELDLRELLNEYGYDGEKTGIYYIDVDELLAGRIDQNQDIEASLTSILNAFDRKRPSPEPTPYILPNRNWCPTNIPPIKRKDKKEKKRPPVVKTKKNEIYQSRISRRGRHN